MTPETKASVDFKTMPARMRDLPLDERGYPVPWFVAWVDGKPEFRAMDRHKFVTAIREKRCWVCAGFAITRNPGVAMLWITRQFEVFKDGKGGLLIQMGEPDSVEWWACGREATRAEVTASIDSGLPNLEALARLESGGLEFLETSKKRFEKWIPA
jgi:hypothetical protein